VSAEDEVARPEAATGFGGRLRQILTTDLFHWLRTLKDRRFYRGTREVEFRLIDNFFRERGFQFSRGMSLKPSRRVLARFPALSGIFHPMEKIYVVAPGDPIFQRSDDSANSFTESTRGRAGSTASGYQPDPVSTLGRIRPPRLIITSQRILEFQDDHWVSHFFTDMLDELPSILSWSETYGWRRALDNDNAEYYRRVRYVSLTRKRLTITCTDTNTAGLVSWLIQRVCEQNESARRRLRFFPFPSARRYLERDVRREHLEMLNALGEPETSELRTARLELPPTPAPKSAAERRRAAQT
jgi:hypothetical protein